MIRFALAALALPLATSTIAAAEELNETIPVQPGGTLTIDLDRGTVDVESHQASEVHIEARAQGLLSFLGEFELTEDGHNVKLEGWFQRVLMIIPWGPRVTVHAQVPRDYSVDLRTRGGRIGIARIDGRVVASTSGGKIAVREIKGAVDVETSGGAIEIENVAGHVTASTSGGPINLSRIDGNVEAVTSGGAIDAESISGEIDARTSGGRITASFSGDPSGSLETSGGGIEVRFSESARVDLDAETSGGRVDVEHRFTARDEVTSRRVAGQINGGGAPLRLRTSGGSIRVKSTRERPVENASRP